MRDHITVQCEGCLWRAEEHLWSSLLRSPSWRARAMTSQMTSSATLRVLLKGALKTGMPTAFAACRRTASSEMGRTIADP